MEPWFSEVRPGAFFELGLDDFFCGAVFPLEAVIHLLEDDLGVVFDEVSLEIFEHLPLVFSFHSEIS